MGLKTLCHTERPADGRRCREHHGGSLRSHARQARPRVRRRQRPVARLGHRQGLPRPGGGGRPILSGRSRAQASRAAGRRDRRCGDGPLRRQRALDHRRGVRGGAEGLDFHRFRGSCHRLFRQGGARRALRRHHAGQLRPHHADLLLFVHRACPARREADAQWRLAAHHQLLRLAEMDPPLQRDGRRQGRAGVLGSLSRRRSRHQEHSRQRDFLGSDQDAGGIGGRGLPLHPALDRAQRAAAAKHHHRRSGRRRALFPLGPRRAA